MFETIVSRRGVWESNDSLCFAAPPPHAELGGCAIRVKEFLQTFGGRGGVLQFVKLRFFIEYLWQKWFLFFGKVLV